MGRMTLRPLTLLALALASAPAFAEGELTLHAAFGDHMVLQREQPVRVRGTAAPGTAVRVRLAAMAEGLDRVFIDAGAEWREAGCSMCLGMNPDTLAPRERSASTSNRNFEGRQGPGGRTHLVSPQVAAATAVRGTLSSPADLV